MSRTGAAADFVIAHHLHPPRRCPIAGQNPILPRAARPVHSYVARETLVQTTFCCFGNHIVNERLKSRGSPVFIEFAGDYTHEWKIVGIVLARSGGGVRRVSSMHGAKH